MTDPTIHVEAKTAAKSTFARAVLYFPVLVLVGAMGAVAMFPERSAYYAGPILTPLLGGKASCPGHAKLATMRSSSENGCGCSHASQTFVKTSVKDDTNAIVLDESAFFDTGASDLTSRNDTFFGE